jgi:hypothetical protein
MSEEARERDEISQRFSGKKDVRESDEIPLQQDSQHGQSKTKER